MPSSPSRPTPTRPSTWRPGGRPGGRVDGVVGRLSQVPVRDATGSPGACGWVPPGSAAVGHAVPVTTAGRDLPMCS